jgi:hypothetical protein
MSISFFSLLVIKNVNSIVKQMRKVPELIRYIPPALMNEADSSLLGEAPPEQYSFEDFEDESDDGIENDYTF